MKTKKILIILLIVVVVGVGGYAGYNYLSKPHVIENVTVRENWVNNSQFGGMYVAQAKGFYKDEGLNVTIKPYEDGLDEGQELAAGKVTYSIYTPIELLADIDKGNKFKAVAAIYQTSPFAFVSLKTTHIRSPQDFVNKVLGAKGGNLDAQLTYPTLARAYGVAPTSYTVKDLDFSVDEGDDIVQKRADMVDLYRTDQVYFLNQRNISYDLLYPEDFGFKSYGDSIVTTQQQITTNPDSVRRFVKATQKGWEYALAHQDEALTIIAKVQDKTLYNDAGHEKYILAQSAPLIQPTGGKPIGSMDVIVWSNVVNAMKAAGSLKTNIDPGDAYTTQFLKDK